MIDQLADGDALCSMIMIHDRWKDEDVRNDKRLIDKGEISEHRSSYDRSYTTIAVLRLLFRLC